MTRYQTIAIALAAVALSAVIAVGLITAPGGAHAGPPAAWLVLTIVGAWAYVAVGISPASRRFPTSVRLLIALIGLATFVRTFTAIDVPAIFILGALGGHLMPVMLGHLLMVFPTGRYETGLQRGIVALAYFEATVLATLAVIVWDPATTCASCPVNPLLLSADGDLFQAVSVVRLTIDCFAMTGLAVMLSRRWYAAVPTQRAVLSPVFWAGGAALLAFFVVFVSETSGATDEVLIAANFGALAVSTSVPAAVVFGLARSRFTRAGAIGDLVATLTGQPHLDSELRDALAEGLEDPSLELAYWLPQQKRYVNADGQAVKLPDSRSRRDWHSVELNGEPVAAILYDKSIGDQHDLIRAAGGAAALTLENQRLAAELRAHVKELRDSRVRLVEAADAERKRIERNLHDGAQQQLLSIALNMNLAAAKLTDDPEETAAMFKSAAISLTNVTEELRNLARGIHPTVLTDHGLAAAVESLVDDCPIRVKLIRLPEKRLPEVIESTTYYVIAEALTNIIRYAQADRATIDVCERGDAIIVEIADDGVGGADPANGTGLRGLTDRVAAVDGSLAVISPKNEGTVVRVELPRSYVAEVGTPDCEIHNQSIDGRATLAPSSPQPAG